MPLANSFQPERKGQLAGAFSAQAKISGAGTTGASLQKSLAGQSDVGSTSLNLSVVNSRNPLIKLLVKEPVKGVRRPECGPKTDALQPWH